MAVHGIPSRSIETDIIEDQEIGKIETRKDGYYLKLFYKCLPVFGGFLLNLALGTIYAFGNLAVYITSYMRAYEQDDIRFKDVSWIYTISVASLGISMLFGGYMETKIGTKGCCYIVSFIYSLSTFASAWAIRNFVLFAITFGFILGLCNGIILPCTMSTVYVVWPEHKGLAGGFVLAGIGVSPCIFGPLQTLLVNPDGKSPTDAPYIENPNEKYFTDMDIINNVPWMLIVMSVLFFLMTFIGSFSLTFKSPEFYTMDYSNVRLTNEDNSSFGKKRNEEIGVSPSEMIKMPNFWLLWIVIILSCQFVNYITTCWKIVGQIQLEINDQRLSYYGSINFAISNTLGRIVWGKLADMYGCKCISMVINFIGATFLFLLPCIVVNEELFFIWCAIIVFCAGGVFVFLPTATSSLFGMKHFSSNYGIVFTGRVISAIVSSGLTSLYFNVMGVNGFTFFVGCLAIASIFISMFLKVQKKPASINLPS